MKKAFIILLSIFLISCGSSNKYVVNTEVSQTEDTSTEEENQQPIEVSSTKSNINEEIILPTDETYKLRKAVYDGDYESLKTLYENETDNEKKELLELAIYNSQQFNDVFNKVFSDENTYKPEVFYSRNISECKYADLIYEIVDARAGLSNLSDDFELIKPNVNEEEFIKTIQEQSEDSLLNKYEEVYKLDIDNDGKVEYIGFYSYKQGDVWVIYEIQDGKPVLNNENSENYNMHWNLIDVYKYKDMYLLISEDHLRIYDNEYTYEVMFDFVDIWYYNVFKDTYKDVYNDSTSSDLNYTVLDVMQPSTEKYNKEVGQKIEVTDEILKWFGVENDISEYGTIDFNNDGILDYTMSNWWANGNSKFSGVKSVTFLDGSTKEVVDFTSTYEEGVNILTVTPKFVNEKNYFLVQYGISYPSNNVYVFKLIEFVDNKPVIVHELLETNFSYIHVELSKYKH